MARVRTLAVRTDTAARPVFGACWYSWRGLIAAKESITFSRDEKHRGLCPLLLEFCFLLSESVEDITGRAVRIYPNHRGEI